MAMIASTARADFSGFYDPSRFTFTNIQADGSVDTLNKPTFITLTGGNNGSGNPGATDFTISSPRAGQVTFSFSYSSTDTAFSDSAGFLLNGLFTPEAASSGQTGTATFMVNTGDVFGFRVATADNTGEPATFTVSSFSAPVPEPSTLALLLVPGAAALWVGTRRRRALAQPVS